MQVDEVMRTSSRFCETQPTGPASMREKRTAGIDVLWEFLRWQAAGPVRPKELRATNGNRRDWPELKAVGGIEVGREQEERIGQPERPIRYFILNQEIPLECWLEPARSRWAVKNGFRRGLGVLMGEGRRSPP